MEYCYFFVERSNLLPARSAKAARVERTSKEMSGQEFRTFLLMFALEQPCRQAQNEVSRFRPLTFLYFRRYGVTNLMVGREELLVRVLACTNSARVADWLISPPESPRRQCL